MLTTKNFIFIFSNIDDDNCVRCYCHYEISDHEEEDLFEVAFPLCWMGRVGNGISYYSPATTEQRDLLFTKMKEAGYEWDDENKELKKIEQILPTWSEEDEKILDSIIDFVMPIGECPDYPTDEEKEYYYEGDRKVDWLKSLKERLKKSDV